MKVKYVRNNSIDFRLIVPGDCFLFKNKEFMRVETICQISKTGGKIKYNAINLVEGYWIGLADSDQVIPIDGKFIINS